VRLGSVRRLPCRLNLPYYFIFESIISHVVVVVVCPVVGQFISCFKFCNYFYFQT